MSSRDLSRPVVPPRPSVEMEEDEALKEALARSLVTAKEDEERRQQRYGPSGGSKSVPLGFDLVGGRPVPSSKIGPPEMTLPKETKSSDNSAASISRPRPQPSNVVNDRNSSGMLLVGPPPIPSRPPVGVGSTPVIPPRPSDRSVKALLDAPVQPPQRETMASSVKPREVTSQTLPKPKKAHSLFPSGPSLDSSHGKPAATVTDSGDIRLQRPPSPMRRRASPVPRVGSGASLTKLDTAVSAPEVGEPDAPLITLSPKSNVTDFELSSLDPFHPTQTHVAPDLLARFSSNPFTSGNHGNTATSATGTQPAGYGWSPAVYPGSADRASRNQPPGSKGRPASDSSDTSSVTLVNNQIYGIFDKPAPHRPKSMDVQLNRGLTPPTVTPGRASPVAPGYFPSDISEAASSTYTIPDGAMGSGIHGNMGTWKSGPGQEKLGQHAGMSDDLMDFSDIQADGYLSLESFDPLYTMESSTAEVHDTSGLFPNPLDRYQRRNTPNPFPDVHALSTQSLMKRASQTDIPVTEISERMSSSTGERNTESVSKSSSNEELLDPFSVNDLTVALERKRKHHAAEQEQRQGEIPAPAIPAKESKPDSSEVTDAVILRPKHERRLSRATSYMAKGEVKIYSVTVTGKVGLDRHTV